MLPLGWPFAVPNLPSASLACYGPHSFQHTGGKQVAEVQPGKHKIIGYAEMGISLISSDLRIR